MLSIDAEESLSAFSLELLLSHARSHCSHGGRGNPIRLEKHGEPLDVGTGRHAACARTRRTFDLACVVPDPGGVAAGGGSPSRACKGSSSRLHAVTRPLQLDTSDAGGRSATWRRGAAQKVDSLGRLRGPPAISLSPPFFSVTVAGDEGEEHVMKGWACSLLSLGLSFADGLWRFGLRLLGLDLNLEPRPKPMLKMGLLF